MTRRSTRAVAVACLALTLGGCNGDSRVRSTPTTSGAVPAVLVIGDSNLFQSGAQVDAALRDEGVEPTLHGVPGYGVKDLEYWLGQLGGLLARDPDIVVVGLGTNDAEAASDILQFPARLDELMGTIGARRVIWLTHVDDRPGAPHDAGSTVNQMVREAATRWPNLTVLDFATEIAADPTILHADALHFSPHGMEVYADEIAAAVHTQLGATSRG